MRYLQMAAGMGALSFFYSNCSQFHSELTPETLEKLGAADPGSTGTTTTTTLPPRVEGFGSGSDAGSFVNNVWTPGRDATGLVNEVSWNNFPGNQWVTVSGTMLADLDAEVKLQIPGWNDYGSSRWDGVTGAWNGLTIDSEGSRAWLVAAGGHADSSNNGIYGLDLFQMKWHIEHLPSDTTKWSAQYRGLREPQKATFTPCYESSQQQASSPINDWFWDELYWDRKPTSRHVYSASAFIPETEELIISTRRLWRYSLKSRQWTYRRQLEDGIRTYDGAGTWAFYDEVTGEYLHGGNADAYYNTIGFNIRNNTWTKWDYPLTRVGTADARHGRQITLISPPTNPDTSYPPVGSYWIYDLDSRKVEVQGNLKLEGLSPADFPKASLYYDGYGACYVPSLNRYWLCTRLADGSMPILEVDPTTTPWTLRRQSFKGAVPTPAPLIMRKMIFFPNLGAKGSVVLVDKATRNISIYKF